MSQEQKQSVLIVLAFAVSVILFLLLIPLAGVKPALGAFGVVGIGGLGPLLFRKKRRPGQVTWDERDQMISRRATLSGAMLSYMTFVAGCMVPWFMRMQTGTEVISIHVLPWIAGAGGIVFFVSRAISLLILYGREGRHGKA